MSEIAPRKQEADLTKDCDETIPQAQSLADAGQLQEALDKLLALEKQTRNAADLSSTSRVLIGTISLLHSKGEHELVNSHLDILSRKHGQLRQAVQKMVDEAMTYFEGEGALEGEQKLKLIETLRTITEGKIYLEVPRARVTRMLSGIKETGGDISESANLLEALQVETFGSMERREKVDFMLEHMRLLRLLKDWDKLAIVAKRVNLRWLSDDANEDLKLRFYDLAIANGLQAGKYLEVCKNYREVYASKSIKEDEAKWRPVLRNIVFFIVLAPYDNEQSDLLHRIAKDDNLAKEPEVFNLVQCFITSELMRWPGIESLYGEALRRTKVFGPKGVQGIDGDVDEDEPRGEKRWEDLHARVVEHNIRTIAKYYTRITLSRLATLLDLTTTRTEEFLSNLVTSKTVFAKIDRPAGLVSFKPPRKGDEILNDWSSDVGRLMGLIEKSCHLIAKEHAVHAALQAQKGLKAAA